MMGNKNKTQILSAALLTLVFMGSCGKTKQDPPRDDPKTQAVNAEVNRLTETAYDLKLEGSNAQALSLLEDAGRKLKDAENCESEIYASNLDDRATIHLRMGHNEQAKALYHEAEAILKRLNLQETRLFAGIERRLDTMKALDALGIVCDEPAAYIPNQNDARSRADAGMDTAAPLSYFPNNDDLQLAFGTFNLEMKGCVESSSGALPIWTVIVGDGRIALASVKSDSIDADTKRCLEKKLMEISGKKRDLLPKFRACFRNFTYPLAFRK